MFSFNVGYLLLGSAVLLMPELCQGGCTVQDGKPGLEGIPGRAGLHGEKGEKGDAAPLIESMKGMKGDSGDKGTPGEMGGKGYSGAVGEAGLPGLPGLKGPPGDSTGSVKQSAFSVHSPQNLEYAKPVKFNRASVNINSDFNLQMGKFTCRVPGVYYFVFHSMSKNNLCLSLKSDALKEENFGFCDYCDASKNENHVLSGGVVLQLDKDEKVWMELFRGENTQLSVESIVFNGFLIFQSDKNKHS
ncbi:complement C1q subcomponent subunit C-like [Brienomyrus brachyistius]|uniref:complement C1q subcomponent subunit C-like n=1 Tax=Brienomyrus brachyistius TaxID=42636 RepID=UPI0020B296CE|nr:complement C1q subcomponent subunit C-like [Brienomyrus brachyistius]XP_048839439.1 complement C1q subcomponent subunit C-like [Brienomyrus brachyistius]